MAAQTFYFKEHEGLGQLSSVLPWLGAFGSQQVYGESYGHSKPFNMELPNSGHHLTATKQLERGIEQGLDKGNTNQFTIFPGDAQKSEAAISLQSSQPKYRGHFELGFSQPMICAKYPYMDQCYGLFSSYGPQVSGRIMLPLSLTTDEGPIYVNAKQYHGIIRRRQSRAKAFMENRKARLRKPYMHESRHLHAMRRPRGCGGRFLNTKTSNNGKSGNKMKQVGDVELFRHSGSQSSEVLQSESGTLNSSKETNGSSSNISGSEVTSTYSRQWITAATSKFDSKRKMGLVLTHCINPIVSATKWRTFVAVTVIVIAAGFGSQVCPTTIWLLSKATHSWLMCRRGVSFDSKQSAVRLASENPEAT